MPETFVIDDTDDDDGMFIDLTESDSANCVDLTGGYRPKRPGFEPQTAVSDTFDPYHIPEGHRIHWSYPWSTESNGYELVEILEANTTVELLNGSFLRIVLILEFPANHIYLKGILMKRNLGVGHRFRQEPNGQTERLHSILPDTPNELCAIVQGRYRDDPPIDCGLVDRDLDDVYQVRKVIISNIPRQPENGVVDVDEELVCRWKYIESIRQTAEGNKPNAWQILHLLPHECDPGQHLQDRVLFQHFQHSKKVACIVVDESESKRQKPNTEQIIDLTGSTSNVGKIRITGTHRVTSTTSTYQRSQQSGTITDSFRVQKAVTRTSVVPIAVQKPPSDATASSHQNQTPIYRAPGGQESSQSAKCNPFEDVSSGIIGTKYYSFADICSGGGGTAISAYLAGLLVRYVLDNNAAACQTLSKNLPSTTTVHWVGLSNWIMNMKAARARVSVDVLHVSMPCQAYSRANPGCNVEGDQEKVDLGYAMYELVKLVRPRVLTMEQVPGMTDKNKQSGHHLYALMHALTSLGYQVRCETLNLAEYGLVQARRRLILVAACPGQPLPWPKPTHGGKDSGLVPFVTIGNVLSRLPRMVDGIMGHCADRDEQPYSEDQQLRNCITTSENPTHPNGKRSFNLRELATIQGFPLEHKFCGGVSDIRRLIGNAVPAVFAQTLFKTVVQTLEKTDEKFTEYDSVMTKL